MLVQSAADKSMCVLRVCVNVVVGAEGFDGKRKGTERTAGKGPGTRTEGS